MLPKSDRLNLKVDFKRVSLGRRFETEYLKIFLLTGQGSTKLGIAVPSKVFKKAHERNRVRRVVATAFQEVFNTISSGVHILVLPKSKVIEVKSQKLIDDVKTVRALFN